MKTKSALLLFLVSLHLGGCWTSTVEGYAGESITIKCPYEKKYTGNKKYFCKEKALLKFSCEDQIKAEVHNTWHSEGRFSLYDDTDRGFFEVIMKNLTKSDEGKYWCAVDFEAQLDEYTEVNLKVKKGSIIPVIMSLAAVGLVLGVALFICWRCIKKKRKDMTSNPSSTAPDHNRVAPQADRVYAEIPDASIIASGLNTVYAEAQLPAKPSSDTTCSTVQLPISHGGNLTHSTVQ